MSDGNEINLFFTPNDYDTEKSFIGDSWWYARTLAKASAKVIEVDLLSLDLSVRPWQLSTIADFISHSIDVERANQEHLILMSPDGWIMNGWHRIAKSLLAGDKTIKAQRILTLPEPDGVRDK